MTGRASCRLYVIFARRGDRAVIFRRGPSKQVQLVLWHTASDKFVPGQWFKGRIHGYCSDLSPDGKYLVYYAEKHTGPMCQWTAISRPPYLTALVLWKSTRTGGGLFESDTSVRLHCSYRGMTPLEGALPDGWRLCYRSSSDDDERETNEQRRLKRDGWRRVANSGLPVDHKKRRPHVWTRQNDRGVVLEQRTGRSGLHPSMTYLVHRPGTKENILAAAEWADFDQQGRIVFARAGGLWEATFADDGALAERLLHDFNEHVFEAVIAPEEMRHW